MLYCYYWSILIANSSNLTCKIAKHMLCVEKYLQYEFRFLILFSVIFLNLSFCYIFMLRLIHLTKLYKYCCGSASWLLLPSTKWIFPHTLFAVLRLWKLIWGYFMAQNRFMDQGDIKFELRESFFTNLSFELACLIIFILLSQVKAFLDTFRVLN